MRRFFSFRVPRWAVGLAVLAFSLLPAWAQAQVSFVIATPNDPIAVANGSFVVMSNYSGPFIAFLFCFSVLVVIGRLVKRGPSAIGGRRPG